MSFSDDGYEKKTDREILQEKEELYAELFDIMNYDPSDVLWQWIKLQTVERREIESIIEVAMEQMSIQDAQGAFLDKWGQLLGINRKGATKAQGYVDVTAEIDGSAITIPLGSRFVSNAGKTYVADSPTEVPYEIEMTKNRSGESDDYFPSSVSYVESITEIRDSNNDVISSDYYSFNTTYNNYIEWDEDSDEVLVKNETYYVYTDGEVTKRVEVTSQNAGADQNALIGTVIVSEDVSGVTVTNSEEIDGAADQESDETYRTRLLQAKSRTFTLESINSIVNDIEGVKSCKTYQNTGVDQSSVSDWENPTLGSNLSISGNSPSYSQQFVPGQWSNGDSVATLGKITLRGRPYNDPPAIYCGLKGNTDVTGNYLDTFKVEEYELAQDTTGFRDIEFKLKYNGLDYTKTYRFDIWCDEPDTENFDWADNHWKIRQTTEGYVRGSGDNRGMLYKIEDGSHISQGSGNDLMFKTGYNAAGFSITVATNDGYGFLGDGNIKEQIEDYLDYVEEGGYSPVCIQATVQQATEILVDIKGTIYITTLADFQNVRRELIDSLETYLESLSLGENVAYARIWQTIMDHEQVINLKDLYIKSEDKEGEWKQTDIGIANDEVSDLGSTSFQRG